MKENLKLGGILLTITVIVNKIPPNFKFSFIIKPPPS